MSTTFAGGKNALGTCDRCGLTYKLAALKTEMVKQRPNGLLVCWQCRDEDHPQLMQGVRPVRDPQALRNPRPDANRDTSRLMTGELVFPPLNGVEFREPRIVETGPVRLTEDGRTVVVEEPR